MKNMKKLVAFVAVFAMMLSMASVAFAAPTMKAIDAATESFNIAVDTKDILVGTTDEFTVKLNFAINSATSAAMGVAVADLTVKFNSNLINYVSWTVSPRLDQSKMQTGSSVNNDGSNGALKVAYKTTIVSDTIMTGDYYEITFKLADGVPAGTTIPITVEGISDISTMNHTGYANVGWIKTANVKNYVTAGAVNVISGEPTITPLPIDPPVVDPVDPTNNSVIAWGTLSDTELPVGYEYGVVAFDGEGDFDATTEGAEVFAALGNKDGQFAVKLLGDLVNASFRLRVYMFDGTDYTYFN